MYIYQFKKENIKIFQKLLKKIGKSSMVLVGKQDFLYSYESIVIHKARNGQYFGT